MSFLKKFSQKKELGNYKGKIITVSAQKGGVGKTTIATHLAVSLVKHLNKKTLIVDMDNQAHTGSALNRVIDSYRGRFSEYLLDSSKNIMDIVYKSEIENLYYIPSDTTLTETEGRLSSKIGKELILKKLLETPKTHFDYIIIDSPPNMGNLTISSLVASDYVLIPTELSTLSVDGIRGVIEVLESIVENFNPELDILGILVNKFDSRTKTTNSIFLNQLKESYGLYLKEPYLPNSTVFKKAQHFGDTVFDYEPNHKITELFKNLTESIFSNI
ncbi:ParA family protein [bacterium]|nr:ParA family protein [bacterium]